MFRDSSTRYSIAVVRHYMDQSGDLYAGASPNAAITARPESKNMEKIIHFSKVSCTISKSGHPVPKSIINVSVDCLNDVQYIASGIQKINCVIITL